MHSHGSEVDTIHEDVSSTQVMFMDAISHVARITRVLRQPKGNMLLLGVGGSGRQSLSRLSTFMAECKIFSIEITKGYGLSEWC